MLLTRALELEMVVLKERMMYIIVTEMKRSAIVDKTRPDMTTWS